MPNEQPGAPMNLIPKLPPQPVPTMIELGAAVSGDGQKFVMIAFHTPLGVAVHHVSVDAIDQLAEGLLGVKKELGPAGLIVPELSPESMKAINDAVLGSRRHEHAQEGTPS